MKNKSIALICFDNPFLKPMEGGKKGMLSRIQALNMIDNYHTDVYMMSKQKEAIYPENNLIHSDRLDYYRYVNHSEGKGFFSNYPISVAKRYSIDCVNDIKDKEYDAVIYEGEHMASYRLENVVNAKKHILYFHDIESNYRRDLAKSENSVVKKIAQYIEAEKYKKLEEKLSKAFDAFLFVSVDEKKEFEKRYPEIMNKSYFVPHSTNNFANEVVVNNNDNQILYIGNLELKNNLMSLLWFTKNVMPIIVQKNENAKLVVVGSVSDSNKEIIKNSCRNVNVAGYVPDLNDVINNSCFIISPVLYGAGVKAKMIDAMSYGQIVIANTKSAEGTEIIPNKHILVSDEPNEMAEVCVNVLKDRNRYLSIAEEGLKFVKKYHSVDYQSEILRKVIG